MDDKWILINKWLENQCNGKYWRDYLATYGYKKVAIYGAGDLGKYLFMELRNSSIEVTTFIDRRAEEIVKFMNMPVITMADFENNHSDVQAVIVSVSAANQEVLDRLVRSLPEMPVMSLRDMIYEM